MDTHDRKPETDKKPEEVSFDSDGPWANAWSMDPHRSSEFGDHGQMGPGKSKEPRRFSRGQAATSY